MRRADHDSLKIFSGRASTAQVGSICSYLNVQPGRVKIDQFPDGELLVKVEEDVRGRDCYIVQSTYHPVNAHLMELLIFIDCLKRASARRVTAVLPYFGYARQDRKDEGRVPITAKLVANLISIAGADRVLSLDMHTEQIQGFFDIPVDHLHAAPVITDYFNSIREKLGPIVLVSPDVGNVKMAGAYAAWLGADLAIIDKRRKSGFEVESANIIGDVNGKTVLMCDDMISTAGTMCEAAKLVIENGATDVLAACTHPVLAAQAITRLAESPISKVIVTDTIPVNGRCDELNNKLVTLSVSNLLGEAIYRIHHNMSVSSLFHENSAAKSG